MTTYDKRHRGPYDRGHSDYYYGRNLDPHCYKDGVRVTDLTSAELQAYHAGFDDGILSGDQKDYR